MTETANVIKSLRPKRPKKLLSGNIFDLENTKPSVFNAYCEHILQWKLEKTSKDAFNEHDVLPLTYDTVDEYIELWEPLLIEEIKCNILNSFSTNRMKPSHCKSIRMSRTSQIQDSHEIFAKLECSFRYDYSPSQSKIK